VVDASIKQWRRSNKIRTSTVSVPWFLHDEPDSLNTLIPRPKTGSSDTEWWLGLIYVKHLSLWPLKRLGSRHGHTFDLCDHSLCEVWTSLAQREVQEAHRRLEAWRRAEIECTFDLRSPWICLVECFLGLEAFDVNWESWLTGSGLEKVRLSIEQGMQKASWLWSPLWSLRPLLYCSSSPDLDWYDLLLVFDSLY
jgi:hypothetical protein